MYHVHTLNMAHKNCLQESYPREEDQSSNRWAVPGDILHEYQGKSDVTHSFCQHRIHKLQVNPVLKTKNTRTYGRVPQYAFRKCVTDGGTSSSYCSRVVPTVTSTAEKKSMYAWRQYGLCSVFSDGCTNHWSKHTEQQAGNSCCRKMSCQQQLTENTPTTNKEGRRVVHQVRR